MDMLLQLAQDTAADPINWQGIALVIGALTTLITGVLGALGYKGKAQQVEKLGKQAQAVVEGVEKAENGDTAEERQALIDALKDATGVELTDDQVVAAKAIYSKHVKKRIKETALAHNVEDLLGDLVRKTTGKLSKEELKKRLEGGA